MNKRREMIQYIIWGVLSMALNVGLFQLLILAGVEYKSSEVITLLIVKIFVYITNKFFVFKTACKSIKELLREFLSFVFARGATMILDFMGIVVLVEICNIGKFISKCIMAVIVVIINYIVSKKFVFNNSDSNKMR